MNHLGESIDYQKNIRGLELHRGRENQYQIWAKYYSFENLKKVEKMLLHNQGKKVCQLPLLASYKKERYVMKPFLQYVWGNICLSSKNIYLLQTLDCCWSLSSL